MPVLIGCCIGIGMAQGEADDKLLLLFRAMLLDMGDMFAIGWFMFMLFWGGKRFW